MSTAFVTDGDQRSALAIVRSLGRRGITVLVGEERPASLASSSRYCAGHVTYPSPERHPRAFQQFLLDFLARTRVDVLLPVTDVTTHAVALRQEALRRWTALAVPPFEAFDGATSKWALMQRSTSCGIRIPHTEFVSGAAALDAVAGRVRYPAVVKPARSWIPDADGWRPGSVAYASSEVELRQLYRERPYLATYPSLIQERIVGPGVGVFVLFDRGRLIAVFGHRRLREKPPSGGVSVLRESVPVAPALAACASQLLGPLGWHGVAMLEFKQDRRSGELYLMEVNGRFWGSLQLAIDAGMDFPYFSYQLARGEAPAVPAGYRTGIRSRWLLGDLDHLVQRLLTSGRDLQLPDDAPSTLRALIEFVKFAGPGLRYEVLKLADPAPGVYEAREYVASLWAAVLRRARQRTTRRPAHGDAVHERAVPTS